MEERVMSVRHGRVVVAGVTAAAAVAVPVAALASGPGSPSVKPSQVASKSAAASKSAGAASEPRVDLSAAAASKSAVAASGARVDRSVTEPVVVAALAGRLGASHNAAQRALEQIGVLGGQGGVDPSSAAFARGLGGEPRAAGGSAGRGEAGRGRQQARSEDRPRAQ
jgi:hypothetical protein